MTRPARRLPSQSQRQTYTQSQRAGPSRSQANRRPPVESDEEGEEIQVDVEGEGSENDGEDGGDNVSFRQSLIMTGVLLS